jgi:hypothetical protein
MEVLDAGEEIDRRADYVPSALEAEAAPDEPYSDGSEEPKFKGEASDTGPFSEVRDHEKAAEQSAEDRYKRHSIT